MLNQYHYLPVSLWQVTPHWERDWKCTKWKLFSCKGTKLAIVYAVPQASADTCISNQEHTASRIHVHQRSYIKLSAVCERMLNSKRFLKRETLSNRFWCNLLSMCLCINVHRFSSIILMALIPHALVCRPSASARAYRQPYTFQTQQKGMVGLSGMAWRSNW